MYIYKKIKYWLRSPQYQLNIWLMFCLMSVLATGAMAQGVNTGSYPYIKTSANELRYDSTSSTMHAFFDRWMELERTGHGRLNIVQIGGSHVQAGTLSHCIRMNLLKLLPVGERGLVFPYSAAAKCNNPADYKISCKEKMQLTRNVYKEPQKELGVTGIAVTANDTISSITVWNMEHRVDWHTDRVVVMGYSPEGVVPLLRIDDREVYPSYTDEATRRFVFNLHTEVDSFTVILPCDSTQTFTLTGIYLGNRKPGLTFHSIGVNGAAVPDYLDKCPRFTSDLRLLRPDMVIFGLGINDAAGNEFDTVQFRANYLRLCDSIRSVSPNCAFVFITNNDSFKRVKKGRYAVNANGALAREVFYRVAKETGGAVWDQFEIMGGLHSMDKWRIDKLAQNDRVHFTREGYTLLGNLFSEALRKELDKWRQAPAPRVYERKDTTDKTTNLNAPYVSY